MKTTIIILIVSFCALCTKYEQFFMQYNENEKSKKKDCKCSKCVILYIQFKKERRKTSLPCKDANFFLDKNTFLYYNTEKGFGILKIAYRKSPSPGRVGCFRFW